MPRKRRSEGTKVEGGETKVEARVTRKAKVKGDKADVGGKTGSSRKRKADVGTKDDVESTKKAKVEGPTPKAGAKKPIQRRSSSSSSESEWEDVAEHPDAIVDADPSGEGTSRGIQITVNAPKTKKEFDMEGEIRRAIKRFKKEFQENLHKAHLLGFIAHGRHLSIICNDELNRAIALSMVPVGYAGFGKDPKVGKDQLKRFVKWLGSSFAMRSDGAVDVEMSPVDQVLEVRRSLESRVVADAKTMALCFVTTIRALGFDARIVINAHPVSRKTESESSDLLPPSKQTLGTQQKSARSKVEKSSSGGKTKKETTAVKRPTSGRTLRKKATEDAECSNPGSEDEAGSSVRRRKEERRDYWAEIYSESVEQWLCIDCMEGVVDNAEPVADKLTDPVIYCLGFDKDLALRDVTSRYSSDFMSTQTRRLRLSGEWLTKTSALFKSTKRMRNRLEDMQLEAKLSTQALPSSIAEYKNHPLYVLKKDLLKFEGIYPADIKPLGFIRNEPVYPRNAVHTLHSKETWRKEALVVKENEEPYKVVKGRPKWNSTTKTKVENREVPVYGHWQTEPYKPQAAKDGIVPRNEYGNVELFKPSMLPPGTVHLELPGLLQVAKKMDIDCVPAMVGWDFHGCGSHPVLNGFVVCEEYKDVLTAAWEEEQVLAAQREKERRSKKAVQNWRRLVKALMVREKLRRKFKSNLGESSVGQPSYESGKGQRSEETLEKTSVVSKENLVTRNRTAWPQCRHEFTGNDEQL